MHVKYILHDQTLAITTTESSYYRTKIYEKEDIIYREESPLTIIQNSCEYYGYSLPSNLKLVKGILQRQSKLPIPVSPKNGLFFLPTNSYRNKECSWISFYKVAHYIEQKESLQIIFHNGRTMNTNISLNQFKLQMKRTSLIIAHFYNLYCI